MLGDVVGDYRLEGKLGEGGMGVVYRATHTVLGKLAAIKMMRPQLCTDDESVKRFFNEAVLTAAIRHPGIVEIFDYGVHESGSAYIAMALLDGESLETRLSRERALGLVESLRIGRQIASALAAAHESGVIHRDLKPDNVFLAPDPDLPGGERIQLLDFGIAKLLDEEEQASSLTQTGTIIGTPLYMSPEQFRGRSDLDGRTDLYALGCMLYRMLAGRPPFSGDSPLDVAAAHIRDAPPTLAERRPGLAPEVAALVEALLAKDRADRPPSAEAVRDRLDGLLATMQSGGPGDAAPELARLPPAEVVRDTESLELAETEAGSSAERAVPAATAETPRRRLGRAAILVGLGVAAAGLGTWGWLEATSHLLPLEPPALRSCSGLAADTCLDFADLLVRGDGLESDRERAAALALSACEQGSPRGCWAYLDTRRIYLTPFDRAPDIGVDEPQIHVVLVTAFEATGFSPLVRRLQDFETDEVGKVGIHLVPLPPESARQERAARAACVAARHGALELFATTLDENGYRPDWDEAGIEYLAKARGLDLATALREYNVDCARSVERARRAYRWFDVRGTTAFVGGLRLDAPFSDEALRTLLEERRHSLRERQTRVDAQLDAVSATERLPVPADGADPASAVLVEYCDPAIAVCRARTQMWQGMEKTFGTDFDVVWRPLVAKPGGDATAALAECAAAHQHLASALNKQLFLRYLDPPAPGAAELRDLIAKADGDLDRYDRDLADRCPAELAANRAELRRLVGPEPFMGFINGRPTERRFLSAAAAMAREEIELARLLGRGTRIPAADYYRTLVTDPPSHEPPFSRQITP